MEDSYPRIVCIVCMDCDFPKHVPNPLYTHLSLLERFFSDVYTAMRWS